MIRKKNKLEVGKSGGKECIWQKRSSVDVPAGPTSERESRKLSEAHTCLEASSLGGDGTEELGCVRASPRFTALNHKAGLGTAKRHTSCILEGYNSIDGKYAKGDSPST